ncbi:hypothetical protein AAC387_Pa08g1898 [Persea americana]
MFDPAKTNKIPIPKCNTVSLLQEKSQRFLPSSGIPASAQDSSSCDTHPSPSVQYWAAFMAAVTLKAGHPYESAASLVQQGMAMGRIGLTFDG